MKKIKDMLKSVKTKKAVVDVVRHINSKDLTEEGKAIVQYLLNLFNTDMKDMKISEMKEEVLTLVQNNAFKNMDNVDVIFENAIKPKKVVVKKSEEATDKEAELLENIMTKKVSKETKEELKKLTPQDIFELCGYRYTYPVFPKTFESKAFEGKEFHRVDESDIKKVDKLLNSMLDGSTEDTYVVVMYFPEYERDYDIDPHAVMYRNTTKSQVLKKYGGKYPNNLDVQSILHFDGNLRTLVSLSTFTGIPYATCCQQQLFETNIDLNCRVTQNGLDYQIYKVKTK